MLAAAEWRDASGAPRTGVGANLLNARAQYAAQEARIVAQAGRSGAVTIATNMAGRGTDIVLGGSPEGLAREALQRAALPGLCAPAAQALAAQPPLGRPVPLRPATQAALRAAAAAAEAAYHGALVCSQPPLS